MSEVEILIVEDDPKDIELILYALKESKLSNKIYVVRDGEEALAFLFHKETYSKKFFQQPKLILLNLKIPKFNGLEVLKQLKENNQTKSIPVVILTSSTQESDMANGYKLGANSYIQKIVDFDEFAQKINEVGKYWLMINNTPSESDFII